jgi:iron-sulfur cluster assembly protein
MTVDISLTDSAQIRILELLSSSNEQVFMLYTTSKGCGGNGYGFGFIDASEIETGDFVLGLGEDNLLFVIPHQSLTLLHGTRIDWVDAGLDGAQFRFDNPNAAGTCGCGSSFHTAIPCG